MQSPTPKKVEHVEMSFRESIDFLNAGDKIHKLEWKDKKIYAHIKDGKLMLHNGTDGQWLLNDGDLAGNDYIVL